ncbi:RING finger protein nhl-1 isoform X1 [Diachasma alloeum]|uniref:RING finger protein nhl-1 isoform X1 n=1 Tax=Diachasma alloeum TaxID=454923 RepID=UPI000738288C|nr:RING finger protein nhl-1 isoform X1 [Diachasma alloeum]XP_015114049.1 RING finger protein nhl-1 isoform X1 [Diachasma alloeum]XP_015114050.1 RING finger protein nhl-1 isoform X1 [Diachasma alloeum]
MEQFEQLLTCAICLDRYRNPKLLPCQHSFCMEPCMDGLIDYVRRQVKCPECRAEHRIPYQGVQAFPTNVTLQRFLELHIEITGELPDPTSGQTMERCGVCSEKSYCSLCVHCDKKCCPECKDAHMDILRREITRINSQVRRGLHRLQDALALVEKNTLGLQTNCASVAEEVDEIYRRLSKALKDRTEYLRNEIERYSGTELRGLIQLKENLELEIANIQSNCDLADAHINENVAWDDAELLDTKELFLRTVEFIRNFEYEAGDYGRRVRFVMPHEPNQLVLHVAGYGELNIKHETGSNSHLGTGTGLAPPGSSPGLMRSKSDHRLASQYRQQEEDRLARNRYVPDYEYDNAPDYESPRNKSRYRSRFMRHRDGEESDGDSRSTVRFTPAATETSLRERVLDTEDAARGPLSGIFRLTDSPRVMKKLQECERAGKRKKEEAAVPQPQAPKPQVQARKPTPIVTKQASEDDEISKIKKQNKSSGLSHTESPDDRQTSVPTGIIHSSTPEVEHEVEEPPRRTSVTRRTSTEPHTQSTRSASSESSTGSESSGSGIRNTGAPFTTEEMKQKYLARTPPVTTSPSNVNTQTAASRETPTTPTSSPRPFQSRFLGAGNRAAPPPPIQITREETPKKRDVEDDIDDEETSSSSEETETETEESEQETRSSTANVTPPSQKQQRSEAAMARTDIGPLLARSAEARRGSKEDSPSTRYSSPRGSPAHSTSSPTGLTTSSSPSGYTSRFLNKSRSQAAVGAPRERERDREREPEAEAEPLSPRTRYAALKERRQRVARSRSSHNFANDDLDLDEDPPSPTTQSPNAYLAAKYGAGSELARSRSTHALKSREPSPDRDRAGAEKDGAALSSWARYLKNKYGNRGTKDKESTSTSSVPSSSTSAASRRLSLGLPLRHVGQTSFESSDDDQKNPSGSPTSPTAAQGIPAAAGSSTRNQYMLKRRQLLKFGMRGSGAGCFTWPRGLAVGPDNSIIVADSSNHRVQVFDSNGKFINEFGAYGSGEGQFDCLAGVAVNRIGQFIIADRYNHRIQVFDPSGHFLRTFGSQGTADGRFNYPWGITTDALGFIYVCDKENHRVQVFQSDGTFVGKFGACGSGRGQLEHPHYIAVSNTNRVIVSDSNNHRIQIFDVGGRVLSAFGSEGTEDGQFKFPRGVAVDDQGYIVVADSGNNRIQIFTPEGGFVRAFGNWGSGDGEFKGLEGVAVTSSGNIVVCDRENHRVQIF